MRCLLNNMQDSDTVATVRQFRRVAVVSSGYNSIIVPMDRLTLMQDLRLRIVLDRAYMNLHKQRIHTFGLRRELLLDCIQINSITLCIISSVGLAVNALFMTGTNIIGLCTSSDRINRQVQLVVLGDCTVYVGLDVFPTTGSRVILSVNIPSER